MSESAAGGPSGNKSMLGRLKRGAPPPPADAGAAPQVERDPVTGLPSRSMLSPWTQMAIKRSHAASARAVVAFVGVGLLRDINDAYGADAGDRLLRTIGERLGTIDMPGTKVLRYEGAEFALVFEGVNHVNALEAIATFLVEFLEKPVQLGSDEVVVRPIIGAAISADNSDNTDDLIRDAHRALATARDAGSPWEIHDESKRGRYETRVDESRLSSALDDGEFVLVYQPIVLSDTRETVGFEAFVRWKAPGATNMGLLLPHDFMPMMEKTGMSVRLGEFVIDEACRQLAEWAHHRPGGRPLFMACNVGGRQLASDGFSAVVNESLARHGIEPGQLCLDITESSLRFTGASAWPVLRELHNTGVKLGLDDFGTGMSSLQYLLDFSLHYIRVASSFVTHVGSDGPLAAPAASIVRHMAAMAAELGIVSIAEGVESEEQLGELAGLGVLLAQGYLFGRPEMARTVERTLDPDVVDDTWDPSQVLDGDQQP
ncbi:MAG: bifunctional diguanylate cyclase/phosphodiesterase [Acidimicrobiales bacterium]